MTAKLLLILKIVKVWISVRLLVGDGLVALGHLIVGCVLFNHNELTIVEVLDA